MAESGNRGSSDDIGILKEERHGAVLRQYWHYFTGMGIQDIAEFSAMNEGGARIRAERIIQSARRKFYAPFNCKCDAEITVRFEEFYNSWNDDGPEFRKADSRENAIDFIFGTPFTSGCFEDTATPVLVEMESSHGDRWWMLGGIR